MALDLAQIMAGGKRRPLGGDDDRAHRRLAGDRRERAAQRLQQVEAQRVARSRTAQHEACHATLVLACERIVQRVHRLAPQRGHYASHPLASPDRVPRWLIRIAGLRTLPAETGRGAWQVALRKPSRHVAARGGG
jgi:hypothetical protein